MVPVPTGSSGQPQPYTSGLKTNPSAGDVLATTAPTPIPIGSLTVHILIASTVTGSARIQQLDADGLTVPYEQYVYFLASTPFEINVLLNLPVEGQSIQVIAGSTLLGSVQVSIFV